MVILELMSSLWLSFWLTTLFLGVPACAHCNGGKLSRYEAASDFQVSTLVHTGQSGYSGQSGQTGQELMDLQDL